MAKEQRSGPARMWCGSETGCARPVEFEREKRVLLGRIDDLERENARLRGQASPSKSDDDKGPAAANAAPSAPPRPKKKRSKPKKETPPDEEDSGVR